MSKLQILNFFPVLLIFFKIKSIKNLEKWEEENRTLIFVYEHARHGARGPSSSYNSIFYDGVDEYGEKWEYDGELSQIGKRQHYYLGVRNRIKYRKLIDFEHYNPMEILIHATDFNRTHQSINSELMGMYGNSKEDILKGMEVNYKIINENYLKNTELHGKIENEIRQIGYQVNNGSIRIFNVHQFPPERYFLVDHCPKINQHREENVRKKVRSYYAEFDEKYADKFTFINKSYFHDFDKMKSITDHFICDYDGKKELLKVKNAGVNLEEFYQFSRKFYGNFIFNYFVDEFTSGLEETHLMQDLLYYMESRIAHYNETTYLAPKMVMDCGHDTTVGPIARFVGSALDVSYHDFCDFACNVYFELFRFENNGSFAVDYFMDDERLVHNMDFYEFKKKMESKFWNDTYADEFCGKKEDTYFKKKDSIEEHATFWFGCTVITTSLFLIFAFSTFIINRKLKKITKKYNENPLLNKELEGNEIPILT